MRVLCASSAVAVSFAAAAPGRVLDHLATELEAGELTFPDEIVPLVQRLGKDDHIGTWITPAKAMRQTHPVGWSCIARVKNRLPALAPEDEVTEHPRLYVVAQALELLESGSWGGIEVITEELDEYPTHMGVGEACHELGITCYDLDEYLQRSGVI
jgi:hypothetical protein